MRIHLYDVQSPLFLSKKQKIYCSKVFVTSFYSSYYLKIVSIIERRKDLYDMLDSLRCGDQDMKLRVLADVVCGYNVQPLIRE